MFDTSTDGRRHFSRQQRVLGLACAAILLLALLAAFSVELSNTQAKSKQDVQARVHERAVLAAALIDSLFQAVQQQAPQYKREYGARVVTAATMNRNLRVMNRNLQQTAYLLLLDPSRHVIAHTGGVSEGTLRALTSSAALRLITPQRPYGLGDLVTPGPNGVIEFAVAFTSKFGPRILLTGSRVGALSQFLGGELARIPGVKGAHNYILDGRNRVLASNNPATPAGSAFTDPVSQKALSRPSGDVKGHYFNQVHLTNSTWRVLLAAPDGPLFASVSGLRKWVPWLIFAAFALIAAIALALGTRVLRASDEVQLANGRLELLNGELESTNAVLERRAAELVRSNADLEQFASIASHDLQEPLRKIRTFSEQLTVTEAERLSDQGRDYLERTNAAAARMQKLIEDLLKFSRVATHGRPFEQVDLARLADEVLEDLEAQVHASGAVVHVGALPVIAADPLQMRQLLQNLISNALKFRRPDGSPVVTLAAELSGENVRIVVSDNGIGFESRYNRRIFRVFERLHGRSEYPGTGIGLALCRKIAERHGGTIVAAGEPGVGSTFTVTLPLRHERIVPHALGDEPTEDAEAEKVHVSV
jgi:signal transduction histidine kinase